MDSPTHSHTTHIHSDTCTYGHTNPKGDCYSSNRFTQGAEYDIDDGFIVADDEELIYDTDAEYYDDEEEEEEEQTEQVNKNSGPNIKTKIEKIKAKTETETEPNIILDVMCHLYLSLPRPSNFIVLLHVQPHLANLLIIFYIH